MNNRAAKRKLLFEYYSGDPSDLTPQSDIFGKKIKRLKQNKVKTIFVITSEAVYLEPYLKLVNLYEEYDFEVISIHIEELDEDHLLFVKNAVVDINEHFKNGSCLIISFGNSVAGPVLACFYIYSGRTLRDAINRVRSINKELLQADKEISFIHSFQKYSGMGDELPLNEISSEEAEERKETKIFEIEEPLKKSIPRSAADDIEQKNEFTVKEKCEDITVIEREEKRLKKFEKLEKNREEETDDLKSVQRVIGFGKFYQSIRFKLITITSLITAFSLSVMIFLATHFFKMDNITRIQENNLYISEVISIKIKSDFQSIIDKSKLLANAFMQNVSEKELESYTKFILHNDRDFLFFGIAIKGGKEDSLKFIKSTFNIPLMEGTQISKKDIIETYSANSQIFMESFDGQTLIADNASPDLKIPAIAISFPFHKDNSGEAKSIIVSYIKLDRFLEAFQSSGITKTFMVNEKGDIIAHSDSNIVLGGGSYITLPIVKAMITSPLQNGQTRYKDENGVFHQGSFKKIGIGGCGVIASVVEDEAFREVNNQQRRNIYLTIIVITIVILIIFFFGKTLTTPIFRLLFATKKIKSGDYNVKIIPTTSDEIGELTSAFIEMGKGLEEREKIKSAFGKFVNPELAEMFMKDSVHLGGARKSVAILFSDIRDFTAMSEKLQPEEVVDFLNSYMTEMVKCVDSTGGIVDKFIGDAIMAEWGVPVPRGNDTERAIDGALLMRKALIDFNEKRIAQNKSKIRIGIGINTGDVLAGQIGSEDRLEYTVIGDAVNLASRIEQLNKPFGTDILISDDSYGIVKKIYSVEKMSPIKVKGKEKKLQIYAVLGRQDDDSKPKTILELRELLGAKEQPFRRRREDGEEDFDTEEIKYEIIEQ